MAETTGELNGPILVGGGGGGRTPTPLAASDDRAYAAELGMRIARAEHFITEHMWDSHNDYNRERLLSILDGTEQQ